MPCPSMPRRKSWAFLWLSTQGGIPIPPILSTATLPLWRRFPGLTIIAAHMGGMEQPEDAAKYLCGQENVYFDTAFASRFLTPEQFTKLVRLHGPERVLFATDCPWSTVPEELALLGAAELTEEERENIAWKNAARLFHLDI